ncbi:MAG: heavy metal translocating P-type ATPase [Hyphomicrobium sp.]|uniref:heavy metal translocating P-type ATPase n=1 Tax=Hyphomicrobium sp. TaxID=82 RepID=UPI003D11B073
MPASAATIAAAPPLSRDGAGATQASGLSAREVALASRLLKDGLRQTDLSVPSIHCGGCVARIERALTAVDGVVTARVNLSTKRLSVRWRSADAAPPPFVETLTALGYAPHLDGGVAEKDPALAELIRALAVAGFASGNIMLLSVSVWSGVGPEARDLFHWLSALIAFPALLYSGRVFFRSAWRGLRRGHTNMDVPISLGVLLAFGMSLYDTATHGQHAYFDASITLLFFLLIGRTLDHVMRERARAVVKGLAQLAPRGAMTERPDGGCDYVPVDRIRPGMTVLLAAGDRIPVDGVVADGASDLDRALVTGESLPQPVAAGSLLQAGTLNLTAPLRMRATAAAADSFLAETIRLMETAESGRPAYRRVADRAAALYAPAIHACALLSFAGWMIATGDLHRAATIAVAVLIITCPCALGLAVPMVQVVAARRLFENGIMVRDGGALERLAEIDTVLFDKTGTLTRGRLRLRDAAMVDPACLALAAAMGLRSRHPHAEALVAAAGAGSPGTAQIVLSDVTEEPGCGMEARAGTDLLRLGRRDWAARPEGLPGDLSEDTETVLARNGVALQRFRFEDDLRPQAGEAVAALKSLGLAVELVSGDRPAPVAAVAAAAGIAAARPLQPPAGKVARIAELAAAGRKTLMVGDGLNDAPALMAAHVSMAPATAADVGRSAADVVFLRDSLAAVPLTVRIARAAMRLVRQNFGLAIVYNAIALPVAVLGQVTPLVAAIAMSFSSMLVVANALRLRAGRKRPGMIGAAP